MRPPIKPPFRCRWCDEMVVPGDLMHSLLPGYHYACALRTTLGSIGHLQGKCSCGRRGASRSPDDANETDPPGLTKRQAARLVADYVRQQQTRAPGSN